MDRRRFIGGVALTLFVPSASAPGRAAVEGRRDEFDYAFFDERFPHARALAHEFAAARITVAVQADITAIWNAGLGAAILARPLTLCGVTTESFFFCLNVMVGEQVSVDARVTRIGSNLRRWTLRSENHIKRRAMSWQTSFLRA
jgi:hypothetical protein